MDILHIVQPFRSPAVQPDRRRREREAPAFELEPAVPREPERSEEPPAPANQPGVNEEGVGERVDIVA